MERRREEETNEEGEENPGVSKEVKQDPSPVEKQEIEKMLNGRKKKGQT